MDSVGVVQEIWEVTVGSRAAKCVWPIQKKGVVRTNSKKEVTLAAASGSASRVEVDAKLEFIWEGKKRCMRILDADVKSRPHRVRGANDCSDWIEGEGERRAMCGSFVNVARLK